MSKSACALCQMSLELNQGALVRPNKNLTSLISNAQAEFGITKKMATGKALNKKHYSVGKSGLHKILNDNYHLHAFRDKIKVVELGRDTFLPISSDYGIITINHFE